jgi:Spy/CpxP family protein refolding chaperone
LTALLVVCGVSNPPPDLIRWKRNFKLQTGQERAWSSPIWYTPSTDARKNAPTGMTVADLKAKGATALGDAQLKALIVGKAFWVSNTATGEQFSVSYTAEGQSNVWHIGRNATTPSSYGNPVRDGYQGTTTPYKIENGKVVTTISQDPFAVTVYKLGDTYYGARSNEFGYANYEMIPTPQFVQNPLTAMLDQFSIELGLTEQQKQQIVPFLQDEAKQLGALKKNTSLKPLEKIEQLKQIGSAIDAKITPLLNPEQQKKFQSLRDEARRNMIEKMGSQAIQKAEAKIKTEM